jgi:hypothetical protein
MAITEPRITYVAFQECEIRGEWSDKIQDALDQGADPEDVRTINFEEDSAEYYVSSDDKCEVWIVRLDGLRKAWIFKPTAIVIIRGNTVKFHQSMVSDEISVDEKEQSGK